MEATLNSYLQKHPDLAAFMSCGSPNMMLFSTAEGDVLWANESFLTWIGYTLEEFTRKDNPITWKDISVRDSSLEADIRSASRMKEGKLSHYLIRKFYVPKNGSPQFVELHVRRYPPNGGEPMAICVVEVTVLHNIHEKMARAYEEMVTDIKSSLHTIATINEEIRDGMQNQLTSGLNGIVLWLTKHPMVGVPVAAVLILLLFGERAFEVVHSFLTLGKGGTP